MSDPDWEKTSPWSVFEERTQLSELTERNIETKKLNGGILDRFSE